MTSKVEHLEKLLAVLDDIGCIDSSCLFIEPKGMATNGGCRCLKTLSGRSMNFRLRELGPILKEISNSAPAMLDVIRAAKITLSYSHYMEPAFYIDLHEAMKKFEDSEL